MHQSCERCTKKYVFIIAKADFGAHFSFFRSKALSKCTKRVKMLIFCEFLFFDCFLLVEISRQAQNDTFFYRTLAYALDDGATSSLFSIHKADSRGRLSLRKSFLRNNFNLLY